MNVEALLKHMRSKSYKPSSTTAISNALSVDRAEVQAAIQSLEDEDQIYKKKNGKWFVPKADEMIGTIAFTRSGRLSFVTSFSGEEALVQVADTLWALNGDKVLVKIFEVEDDDIPHGRVVKILERFTTQIVGIYRAQGGNFGYIVPDDTKIIYEFRVAGDDSMGVSNGEKAVAKVKHYPDESSEGIAKVMTILGKADSYKVDLPSVLAKYQLPEPGEFPKNVRADLKRFPKNVTKKAVEGRKDFRGKKVFTIDGDSAKDFDDAVSIEKLGNGNYLLGIHIADVSNYVLENSELDKEAFRRGTSVYLMNSVVPMLPFELSNDLCSLVEGRDRLTVSVEVEVNEYGRIVGKTFSKSVIRSVKRLTYDKVRRLLEEPDASLEKEIGFLREDLEAMARLAHIIKTGRLGRGSIEFQPDEVEILFAENGEVDDIVMRKQNVAEAIIEEFMITANESVAELFDVGEFPFIYRVHAKPDPEALKQLSDYLKAIGIKFKMTEENVQPVFMQRILEQIKGHPLEPIIQRLLVRSMKKAIYSETNVGHFGLASLNYTHFTSPIRRYPDLVVHRLLKTYIEKGDFDEKLVEKYSRLLPLVARQSSKREIIAEHAERDLVAMKKAEFAKRYVGEVFDVVITDVTEFGMFVEIPNKAVSGLIHISTLNDYYVYDQKFNMLTGEHNGKIFRLGDRIKAKIVSVNKTRGLIDFIWEDEKDGRKGKTSESPKKGRGTNKRNSGNGRKRKRMH